MSRVQLITCLLLHNRTIRVRVIVTRCFYSDSGSFRFFFVLCTFLHFENATNYYIGITFICLCYRLSYLFIIIYLFIYYLCMFCYYFILCFITIFYLRFIIIIYLCLFIVIYFLCFIIIFYLCTLCIIILFYLCFNSIF